MRYTQMFGKTLRNVHHGVKSEGFALLLRGGYVRSHGNGLFSYLPLGQQVVKKVKAIIRDEMDSLGGQEVSVPLVNPLEMWEKSGRDRLIDKDMIRFQDRTDRHLVLAPSHEETFVELVRVGLRSYRDLPVFLYQFQNKFRDEERVRYGLIRGKEFLMKDAYSFHRSSSDLNNFFPKVFAAYMRIFERCGLDIRAAESGVGYMGGSKAFEFLLPCDLGDDVMVQCSSCGYVANKTVAMGLKKFSTDTPLDLQEVETPDCTSMEDVSSYLQIGRDQLAKTMVFKTLNGMVMAVVRGDYEVSREKLSRYLGDPVLDIADSNELKEMGYLPGYLSPIGLELDGIKMVVDGTVANSANLVVGANKEGYHLKNANFGRDFESPHVADISMIKPENRCLQCNGHLEEIRALEMGNIFKLEDFYSRSMELFFQDDLGKKVFPYMGSYGIGIDRLIGGIVEKFHDRKGIMWPSEVAPYRFFLMGIGKSSTVRQKVEGLYEQMKEEKDTLLDDRRESPGVKFQDADLIGIPYRIVISSKHCEEETVELYDRYERRSRIIAYKDLPGTIKKLRSEPRRYVPEGAAANG